MKQEPRTTLSGAEIAAVIAVLAVLTASGVGALIFIIVVSLIVAGKALHYWVLERHANKTKRLER